MRERFCRQCGKWHDVQEWPGECFPRAPQGQSDTLPVPHLITDTMDPVQSMLDGQFYTSKSALRSTYKAAGVVEIGNDAARLKPRQKPKPDKKAIRTTIEKATARFNRGERTAQK